MAIPEHDPVTGYLPPGEHEATLAEVEARYAHNYGRRSIFANLQEAVKVLYGLGAETIWIDGSFITQKYRPNDVEVVYEAPPAVDTSKWGDYSPSNYERLKSYRKIDLWPYPSPQPTGLLGTGPEITIIEFFSKDRDDIPKGILRLTRES